MASQIALIVLFAILLVRGFLVRNRPPRRRQDRLVRALDPAPPLPDGSSGVYARAMTIFTASSDAARFRDLKEFLRDGIARQPTLMRIYRVAGCKTEIEIPAGAPDYDRIDASEALALLRELPDLRLVRRLHLSDERSFLDPWVRKIRRAGFFSARQRNEFQPGRALQA